MKALFRGNMPNIYKNSAQLFMKISLYDKIKNYWMPYDFRKYSGVDYFWRAAASAAMCMLFSTALVYPLDTIHTKISTDMTAQNKSKLFNTTFDCFNRTNLDEGRMGLYKGVEISLVTGALRACLTLPVYDMIRRNSLMKGRNDKTSKYWDMLGASATSGILISLILYPFDTVMRSMQINGSRGHV